MYLDNRNQLLLWFMIYRKRLYFLLLTLLFPWHFPWPLTGQWQGRGSDLWEAASSWWLNQMSLNTATKTAARFYRQPSQMKMEYKLLNIFAKCANCITEYRQNKWFAFHLFRSALQQYLLALPSSLFISSSLSYCLLYLYWCNEGDTTIFF